MPKAKPKAKPEPKPEPRWRDRAALIHKTHPWLTWGTVASIAGIVSIATSAVMWLGAHFQTADAADLHEKQDARYQAETLYGQQRIETLILRNRLTECNAKVKPTERERADCAQYSAEYDEAAKRTQYLYQRTQERK